MINNIINKIAIPEKYDPSAKFSSQMIFLVGLGMVLILTAMILIIHFKRKRQKGSWFAFLLGISVYLLFCNIYFLPNIILSLLCLIKPLGDALNESGVANCLIIALVIGATAYFGRTLTSYLLRKRLVNTGDHFSIGLAIAIAIGFFSIINLIYVFFTCIAINQMGLQALADTYDNEADLITMFDSVFDMMALDKTVYFFRSLSTISVMVAQFLLTIPILAFIQKKIDGKRYLIFPVILVVINFAQNLGAQTLIPGFVEAFIVIGLTVVIFFLVRRTYNENYKDDEYMPDYLFKKKNKEAEEGNKSMPKFNNLSKL